MVLTLYKMDASPPVRAVLMTIEALKIPDVKYVELDLLAGEHLEEEFLKINPQHTVPALTDGDLKLWDSHAIMTYLVNKYAKGSSLYPLEPEKRALIDLKLHFDSGILYPAFHIIDEAVFFEKEAATVLPAKGVAKFKEAYEFMEIFLNGVQWLAGDQPTLADISCVSTISTMNEFVPVDGEVYPNLSAWFERCSQLDYYKKGNTPGLLDFRKLLAEYFKQES